MNRILFAIFFSYLSLNANCQTVDFTFETSNGLFCNPSTVIFKQTCTGNPISFLWNFGNNQYGDKAIESTSYLSAGSYTVKLTAIFANTTLEVSKTIVINPAVTSVIGFDKNYICQPGTINFTGSGIGGVTNYEWDFGDGTPIANTPSSNISHIFASFGTRNVSLKTTSNSGCSDTSSTVITIKKLAVTGTVSQFRGCIPATANFKANVVLPVNSTVTSYTWDYGDGSPLNISTFDTTSQIYTAVGNYFPTLTVTTSEGCTNTYNYNRFYFGTPPFATIAYPQKNPVCASDSVVFIVKSTNANRYYWDFGDGTNASSIDTIIKHKYTTIGNKKIIVYPYYNECPAPSSFVFFVNVIGVVAKYSLSNTCSNKNTYSFTDTSNGIATSTLWNFGDGVQLPNAINAVHTFPSPGQFTTTLSLVDAVSGCTDSISKVIFTASPALFSKDSSVCKNSIVSFSIINNYSYTDTSARYTWNIMGNQIDSVKTDTISIKADSLGIFNNFVVINHGGQSCPDTILLNRLITVKGPDLKFNAPTPICLNTPLLVTNNSQPFIATDSVKLWYWNFGNSTTNDSIFQPAPFQYTNPGSYTVKLTAIDKNGCEDTLSKVINVNPSPFLHVTPLKDSICFGQSVTMIAFHSDNVLWSPGASLSCATCDTTLASPPVSTKYYATATNSFNCSVQDSNYIEVAVPFTTTIVPSQISICQQQTATIDVNPKGKKILWSPTAGLSNPTIYNPVITGTQNTVYTATLSDSTGCLNSSATVNILIKPLAVVDAGPDKFYPKGTSFSITPTYSNNIISYLWTPSDLLDCSDCAAPNGVATATRKYIVKVTSDSGCVAFDSLRIAIDCKSANLFVPSAFSPNNDNLNDLFYPVTNGIASITKFTIFNRMGEVIYQASNFSPNDKFYAWDGKFKGVKQPIGTYIYSIEAICEIGEKILKKGSVILLR
jgi:gliding motility-associated-like protein